MSAFDEVLELYAEIKATGKQAERELSAPGDETVITIVDASKINALLIKGKAGARYRIDGFHVTREK